MSHKSPFFLKKEKSLFFKRWGITALFPGNHSSDPFFPTQLVGGSHRAKPSKYHRYDASYETKLTPPLVRPARRSAFPRCRPAATPCPSNVQWRSARPAFRPATGLPARSCRRRSEVRIRHGTARARPASASASPAPCWALARVRDPPVPRRRLSSSGATSR